MITMLLGGLWHGAAWTFVAWGGFHGAIQILYRALGVDTLLQRRSFLSFQGALLHGVAWLSTMLLVMVGWVFFVSHTFSGALTVLQNLTQLTSYSTDAAFTTLLCYAGPLAIVEIYQRISGRLEILNSGPFFVRYAGSVSVALTIIAFSARGGRPFIYFDF
jgi:D-alanyl-lipoteichoic acid acyltransferase DltB (MBOAT superfamily)